MTYKIRVLHYFRFFLPMAETMNQRTRNAMIVPGIETSNGSPKSFSKNAAAKTINPSISKEDPNVVLDEAESETTSAVSTERG